MESASQPVSQSVSQSAGDLTPQWMRCLVPCLLLTLYPFSTRPCTTASYHCPSPIHTA